MLLLLVVGGIDLPESANTYLDCVSHRNYSDQNFDKTGRPILDGPYTKSVLWRHGVDEVLKEMAISEFPKWRKYLILLSFLDNSSARPVQIGGVDVNICHSRSTAVRGRRRSSSQSPPRGPFCRTRTGPVEADGAVDAQNAPTAPWKTLCVFHELPQGLSHQVTHEKLRKAPKYRWETRIDPKKSTALQPPFQGYAWSANLSRAF